MRMAIGVQLCVAVEAGGFHDQLIAIPVPRRDAIPAWWQVGRPFEVRIQRNPMEPGVLFPEKRERIRMLNNLDAVRRIETARHAERQTASRIIAMLFRFVNLP